MSEFITAHPYIAGLIGAVLILAVVLPFSIWRDGRRSRQFQERVDRADAQLDQWVMSTHLCHACGGSGRVPRDVEQEPAS